MIPMDISRGLMIDLPPEDIAKAGGLYKAHNVLPLGKKYVPIPSQALFLNSAVSGTPLRGYAVQGNDSVWHNFVGTSTKLYKLTASALTDITRASGNYTATQWNFEVYGNWLIATNGTDAPQILKDITLTAYAITSITSAATTATVTTTANHGLATGDNVIIAGAAQTEYNGTYAVTVTGVATFTYTFAGSATSPATGTITWKRAFQALGGSPPIAKFCLMNHGHLILACLSTDTKGIAQSALENIEDWTPSLTTGADTKTFPELLGSITGVASIGDNFSITSERSLVLGYYSGGVYRFDFRQNAIKNVGNYYSNSLVSSDDAVFFWSFDSIFRWDGQSLAEIGSNIKNYVMNNLNVNYTSRIQGVHYKTFGLIAWLYVSQASTSGVPDKLLLYNYREDRFTTADLSAYTLWIGNTGGKTIDSFTTTLIDNMNIVIDSNYFSSGAYVPFTIKGSDSKPYTLVGDSMSAELQTGELVKSPLMLMAKKAFAPVEALTGSGTIAVYHRYDRIDSYTQATANSIKSDGTVDLRSTNRRLAFNIAVSGFGSIGNELELEITETGGR